MRRAQHEFRTRQQAAKEALEQRIATLEDIIEQMGFLFGTFADSVLCLQVVHRDQDFMNSMQSSMRRFVALAHVAQGTAAESNASNIAECTTSEISASNIAECTTSENSASNIAERHAVVEAGPSDQDEDVNDQEQDRSHALFHGTLSRLGEFTSRATEYLSLSPKVFGNGWLGQLPVDFARLNESSQFDQPLTSDMYNLALKLLRTTLNIAYYSLLGNVRDPTRLGRNMFRYALSHHSKEELLYTLRWFLGPGNLNMIRLGSACLTPIPSNERHDAFTKHLLRPVVDSSVEKTLYRHHNLNENPPAFLDAFGIERCLLARGARFIDQNRIEMAWQLSETSDRISASNPQLPSNESPYQGDRAGPAKLSPYPVVSLADVSNGTSMPPRFVTDMFSFDAFMGSYGSGIDESSAPSRQENSSWSQPHPSVSPQIISVSKLCEELAGISTCLSAGPGYELSLLENAIMLSTL